eukprot:CAMPEP_0194445556 /NCGR_PEP_ID=MMETSP0176-20130528/127931_1 /TAXON_ID=216777 /ORGANISM="Proboscia alata, Strain PI-D3" /LENGTH=288 /DNA_ID=CAMNT_0039272139 /DNA_START=1656 /DNA_END=2518 /DNA_ORIENTATION=-
MCFQRRVSDDVRRKYGMVTSLCMTMNTNSSQDNDDTCRLSSCPLIVACGMESGHVFYHDCRYLKSDSDGDIESFVSSSSICPNNTSNRMINIGSTCSIKLGNDPVLCLDVSSSSSSVPSSNNSLDNEQRPSKISTINRHSILSVAGCAADAAELSRQIEEQIKNQTPGTIDENLGTINLIKTSFNCSTKSKSGKGNDIGTAQIRRKLQTCSINEKTFIQGKPGVACCQFSRHYPDTNQMIALGGWDYRTRLFSRHGKPLAILRNHSQSVTCIDWSVPFSSSSNCFLAT